MKRRCTNHAHIFDTMVSDTQVLAELTSNWLRYVGAYVSLCLLYLTVGIRLNRLTLVKGLLKCAPILFLIYSCVPVLQTFGKGPVGHVELARQFERVIFGLIFSCIGDFYLVFDAFFFHGIASFAIAQGIYVFLFHGQTLISVSLSYNEVITGVGVAIVSLSVYSYLFSKFSRILAIFLAAYCILISTMLWSSLVQLLHAYNQSNVMGAIGAGMFYTSDLLLGVNKWRIRIPFGPELVMVTYYLAQFLIMWSQIIFFV